MTREQCIAERNDVEWIKHPEWWGGFWGQVCTLKRSADELGTAANFGPVVGYITPERPLVVNTGMIDRAPTAVKSYMSAEAIVADGWRVD